MLVLTRTVSMWSLIATWLASNRGTSWGIECRTRTMKQDVWVLVSCSSVLAAEDPTSWSILFHSPLYIHLLRSSLFDCFNVLVSLCHSTWLYRSAAFCMSLCETMYRIQLKTTVTLAMRFNSSFHSPIVLYSVGPTYTYTCPVNCTIVCV